MGTRWHNCAAKVEHGFRQTSSCETWIWILRISPHAMIGDSRLWPKVCHSSALVSAPRGDSSHRKNADRRDGVALSEARKTKESGRVRMVVIAGEVGGRWLEEMQDFLWSLAYAKSRSEVRVLRGSVRAAWRRLH